MNYIFRLTFMNMKIKKARTILTLLGVTIGVIAVVSLLSLGIGVKKEFLSMYGDSDSLREIVVEAPVNNNNRKMLLTEHNIARLENIDKVLYVYPRYDVVSEIKIGNYTAYVNITGLPADELYGLDFSAQSDTELQAQKPSLILGNSLGYLLYNRNTGEAYADMDGSLKDYIGKKIQVVMGYGDNEITDRIEVAGVMEGDADDFTEKSQNVYCDIDSLIRYLKKKSCDDDIIGQPLDKNGNAYSDWVYTSAVVVTDDVDSVDFVVKKLKDMGYTTSNNKEYRDQAQKTIRIIQLLLGGIGAIALIVAVIGISNTMTTSVYDRVGEIGLLKVLGCDIGEIHQMFLLESGIFGLIGGLLGVFISFVLKNIINKISASIFLLEKGTELAVMPMWLGVLAVVAAMLLGILAGYIPARWAAGLKPLEAMNK